MFRRKRYRNKVMALFTILFCLCTLTLGYATLSQDLTIEGTVEAVDAFSESTLINNALAKGDLVADTVSTNTSLAYTSKYYYKGSNPNNYIIFANKCFRIVNISQNDTMKIIYDGNVSSAGDCTTITTASGLINNQYRYNALTDNLLSGVNNWFDTSEDADSLRKTFEGFINAGNVGGILLSNTNLNNMANATWYVGAVDVNSTQALATDITNERTNKGSSSLPSLSEVGTSEYSYTGKVGLLNITDYVKASTNTSCSSVYTGTTTDVYCASNNYLVKNYTMITMNPAGNSTDKIWAIKENGQITYEQPVYKAVYVRPVFYLVSGLNFAGEGTVSNPYVIV